uniref:Uncharacterized protein n=1 Tax=viral metagenome TaxID=1070528 RepID=A0A6H1ZNM1_9ZZZZ
MEKMSAPRGMAQSFLEPMFKEGYTSTQALGALIDWGIGYRRTDFLDDWRRISGRPAREDLMKYVPKKYRPPSNLIETTPEYLSRQFRCDFTVRGSDVLTGEDIDTGYSLARDELTDIRDLESEMWSALAAEPDEYQVNIDELFLRGVKTRMPPL